MIRVMARAPLLFVEVRNRKHPNVVPCSESAEAIQNGPNIASVVTVYRLAVLDVQIGARRIDHQQVHATQVEVFFQPIKVVS
jgi:hypothetical protein